MEIKKIFLKEKKLLSLLAILAMLVFIVSCQNKEDEITKLSDISNTKLPLSDSLSEYAHIPIDSLNHLAIIAWSLGNYQNSLSIINTAYAKAKKNQDEEELAKVLNTLGLVYWRLGNNEDAMQSYNESGRIAEKLKMYRLLGLTHTNQGLILKEQKKYEQAFYHNNIAIDIFMDHNEYRDLAIALNNQGQIFKNQKRNDSAKAYYLKALKNYEKADYKDGVAATYYNLSEVYLRQGLNKLSLDAAQKSLSLGLEINNKIRISEAYQKISEAYEKSDQPDSALKYFKIYNEESNNILIATQSKSLAKYQAEMGAELKNLQIHNLQKEKKLANNRIWFIVIVTLIFLLILSFIMYRYLQKIRFKKHSLEVELINSKRILNVKEQELKTYILDLTKKNAVITKLQGEISREIPSLKKIGPEVTSLLKQKILTEEDWKIFKSRFKSIYPGFFSSIKRFKTNLTEGEVRLLVLLHLDLTGKEMADILGISPQSARVSKMRLKKKLNKEGYDNVEEFLNILVS